MAWQRNQNSSIYANTSSAIGGTGGGSGSVSGTKSPGGSLGKSVSYVNDNPWSDTNTGAGAGSYHPRHLYGRRGHTQGAQTQKPNYSGGGYSGGLSSVGNSSGFGKLAAKGSWTGSSPNSGGTPSISGIFTGGSVNPGSVYGGK